MTESTDDDRSANAGLHGTTVLVTGASGSIGAKLVAPLLDAGARVRVLTRHRSSIADRPWADRVDVVEGDAGDPDSLRRAVDGVDVAYYLLHSMGGADDFVSRDRTLAHHFADACTEGGVSRIVYLGGIHPRDEKLSKHLASRVEVGEILLACPVPAIVLEAAVILGAESASYAMLRHLTSRLPAMITPAWARNKIQPIAVDDAVHYLIGAATIDPEVNRSFDIAGPEVLTYIQMMQRFAALNGLGPRPVLTVPVFTPWLASHWVGLVTPVDPGVARPLVGSLLHEVIARDHAIAEYVPDPEGGLTGFDEAVRRAEAELHPDTAMRNVVWCLAATAACAVVGSWATTPGASWYRRLRKPAFQPPTVVFPIVWTLLYTSLAVTSASVLTRLEADGRTEEAEAYRQALAANLALNAGWSLLFWRLRVPGLAVADCALLSVSAADLARRAGEVGPVHRALLTPYAAWCGFATSLSSAIAQRNGWWRRQR